MQTNQPDTHIQLDYPRVSYYYMYGRKHQYGTVSPLRAHGYERLPAETRFFSYKHPHPLDDGPQTVEDLVQQGYFAAPVHESETAILHDRRDTAWLGLDDVLTQIHQRHEVYRQNLLELQGSECYAFNELARGGWPPSPEQYVIYDRRMQDLSADRRAERVALWRDVSRLRERIPESAQLYLSSLRKLDLLQDPDGDSL